MLDQGGFDLWADGYDKSVGCSDEDDTYPFAGYKRLLGRIYEIVVRAGRPSVLDIGFGTGVLTAKLYEAGCQVYGQDFSERMIQLAREKMPNATLIQGDFTGGLAPELADRQYDFILSTYALHHLRPEEKAPFFRMLLERLAPGGQILIGDVAFATQADQEACRCEAGGEWDDEEFYFVYDEMKAAFPSMGFEQISHCAGLLSMKKEDAAS